MLRISHSMLLTSNYSSSKKLRRYFGGKILPPPRVSSMPLPPKEMAGGHMLRGQHSMLSNEHVLQGSSGSRGVQRQAAN